MQFSVFYTLTAVLAAVGLASACTPGTYTCGNVGSDTGVFVCTSGGAYQLSADCGANSCESDGTVAYCLS